MESHGRFAQDRPEHVDPWPQGRPGREVMEAVERSLQAVADRPVRLAEVFYRQLFEMVPATRAMFAEDMSEQMQKMTDTLVAAISQLLSMDTADLEVVLYRLGYDHYERYAVAPDHYMYIAHALTRAVREVAGWEYTSYLSSCWIALCQWVTGHMISGARAAIAAERPRTETLVPAVPAPRSAPTPAPTPGPQHRLDRSRRFSGA